LTTLQTSDTAKQIAATPDFNAILLCFETTCTAMCKPWTVPDEVLNQSGR
jgi:hypothetical protein